MMDHNYMRGSKRHTTRIRPQTVAWTALLIVCVLFAVFAAPDDAHNQTSDTPPVNSAVSSTSDYAVSSSGGHAPDSVTTSATNPDRHAAQTATEIMTGPATGSPSQIMTGPAAESPATDVPLLDQIPPFSGEPYIELCGGEPGFVAEDATTDPIEYYAPLDEFGRCGPAFCCLGLETLSTEPRGSISSVHPTGWHNKEYDIVDGGWLYNRCHLVAHQLAGEDANPNNLITGTRYFNVEGMLPFEEMVADYIRTTGNHVLYRVTPLFAGDNLVASGVQMEALSMEDGGMGMSFNVFVYNCQPGVIIDYGTGENYPA